MNTNNLMAADPNITSTLNDIDASGNVSPLSTLTEVEGVANQVKITTSPRKVVVSLPETIITKTIAPTDSLRIPTFATTAAAVAAAAGYAVLARIVPA